MKEKKEEVVSSRGGAVGLATIGFAGARGDLRCREVKHHRGGEGGGERPKNEHSSQSCSTNHSNSFARINLKHAAK